MAHPDAADRLDDGRHTHLPDCSLQRRQHLHAASGDAAGAGADAYLRCTVCALPFTLCKGLNPAACLQFEEIREHLGDAIRRNMAVGDAVYLHYRGQRAAAQAVHTLQREKPVGSSGYVLVQAQVPAEGVAYP